MEEHVEIFTKKQHQMYWNKFMHVMVTKIVCGMRSFMYILLAKSTINKLH